jgi:serine/threonine protein kinase
VECEGVLKLQATPFKNCIEIETDSEILFLESVELTLRQLLEGRLNTNKLFLAEDIDRLIEGVTFALAHLQQNGVTYKDIDAENIFYDNGNFKLLPNELICLSSYQKLREGAAVLPSPELIIALRCGEEEVSEDDILEKSNVFTFGMVLLEVCTLLPSEECYDSENYDILDAVINERVMLVEDYYGERVAKIVANMLDYDYTERMNLKDLSIWVNRQLQPSRTPPTPQHPPNPHSHPLQQEQLSQSVLASKVEKNGERPAGDKSRSRLTKNNSVYMNPGKEEGFCREERNKIYINDSGRQEEPRVFNREPSRETLQANRHYRMEEKPSLERFAFANQSQSMSEDSYKLNDSLPHRDHR